MITTESWRTLVRCPNCKATLITDGSGFWCEKCDYVKGRKKEFIVGSKASRWSEEETQFILNNFYDMTALEMSQKLKRGRNAINAKISHLRKLGYNLQFKRRNKDD